MGLSQKGRAPHDTCHLRASKGQINVRVQRLVQIEMPHCLSMAEQRSAPFVRICEKNEEAFWLSSVESTPLFARRSL